MFHFQIFNIPLSLDISSEVLDTIFSEVAKRNPITQEWTINIVFVWDDEMKTLNSQYRQKDSTTDVLSFHYFEKFEWLTLDDVAGEILLSESKILSQAKEYDHSAESETYKLITHGLLHIIGYDHETDDEYAIMHPKEIEITNTLRDTFQIRIID